MENTPVYLSNMDDTWLFLEVVVFISPLEIFKNLKFVLKVPSFLFQPLQLAHFLLKHLFPTPGAFE